MRKWIGLLLIAALAVSPELPAFAAEQDTQAVTQVTVSLSTIESVMKQYNLDLQTQANNLQDTRKSYEDSNDDINAKNTYEVALVQYNEQQEQKILNVKQEYLTLCSDSDTLAADQALADSAKKTLAVSEQKLAAGYITQKQHDDDAQSEKKAANALQVQDAQVTRERKQLLTDLNIPTGTSCQILPLKDTDVDVTAIPNISFSQDNILMYQSNADIIAAEMNYNYEKDDDNLYSTDTSIDNARITYEQTKSQQTANFQKQYDALMSSYQTYQQEASSVSTLQNTLSVEQAKLTSGYSTQQQVDKANSDFLTEKSTLSSNRSTLFLNYLKYEDLKNGLSVTSSGV